MGSSPLAQGDGLGALWPHKGVIFGEWEGDARGRGYWDICTSIADSLCYTAATNTPLQSDYTPIKMLKKNNKWSVAYTEINKFKKIK